MKSLNVAMLAAAATIAMGGVASAQEDSDISLSFNAGAATDYVFRGVSQTDEGGQIFAGADVSFAKIGYAGLWVSNVEFNNGTELEYDLYAGLKPTLGPVALDLGVIYYGYTNSPSGPDQDYVEFKVAGSVPVGPGTIGAAVYYSNDFFGETGEATYYEVNGSLAIPDTKFSVSGALGKQEVVGPADYTTWNFGAGYALNDHVGFDLRYHDTNEHDFADIYESRVVLGIKATF